MSVCCSLGPGDCGSFIYLVDDAGTHLGILGMLFGRPKSAKNLPDPIYQAVILKWNLKQMNTTTQLKLSEIEPINCAPKVDDNGCLGEVFQDLKAKKTFENSERTTLNQEPNKITSLNMMIVS